MFVDSEIVLSTSYGKTRVFINKTLSTETAYQQDLINRDLLSTRLIVGKVGPGMWCGKCNSTSNVLVCETQRKVNMYGCVSEWVGSVCVCGVCVSSLFISWKMNYGACLAHIRSIMVVSRSLPRKSVCTSPTRLKNLSGDTEVTGTVRYCLVIRTKSGNSWWYCFQHIRGSVSLDTCCTRM